MIHDFFPWIFSPPHICSDLKLINVIAALRYQFLKVAVASCVKNYGRIIFVYVRRWQKLSAEAISLWFDLSIERQ